MSTSLVNAKIDERREEQILKVINMTDKNKDENYDYGHFKAEYIDEVKLEEKSNSTLNHTEVEEEETIKEAMHKMVDFKETSRNCTEEERKGIGR